MGKEPVCPVHRGVRLVNYPDDQIRQWECPICNWMATDQFIKDMTPEVFDRIKSEFEKSIAFRVGEPLRSHARKLHAQIAQLKEKEEQKQQDEIDWKRKYKNIRSLNDFNIHPESVKES